ncbi:MAG TPA: NAD(P)-dependent oxidoreductase [Planctomycetota bacterium]
MRILLTGVTGFIGSHVARELLRGGHEVHASVRPGADARRVADLPALRLHPGGLDHVPVAPDLLISLAWIATPGKYLESPENVDCLRQTRSLLSKVDCRAVVAGTCFEFDTSLGTLREDSPVKPTTLYARSKDELRREVEKRHDSAWIRFFYQYGPWEDERRLVPAVIRSLLKGQEAKVSPGGQRRDFLHVEDVAAAVRAVAESPLTGCVNVGSGEAPAVKEIVTTLGEAVGRPELLRFGAVPYYEGEPMLIVADNAKLRSTGWAPRWGLKEGLRHAVEWWRARA